MLENIWFIFSGLLRNVVAWIVNYVPIPLPTFLSDFQKLQTNASTLGFMGFIFIAIPLFFFYFIENENDKRSLDEARWNLKRGMFCWTFALITGFGGVYGWLLFLLTGALLISKYRKTPESGKAFKCYICGAWILKHTDPDDDHYQCWLCKSKSRYISML
jgi:hypothetical protein